MVSCLVNICKEIFVLEVKSPVFLVVVSLFIIIRWEISPLYLLHVHSAHLRRRDGAWSERDWLLIFESAASDRSILKVDLLIWTSSKAMWRWTVDRVLLHHFSSWQIYFFCRKKYICVGVVIIRLWVWVCLALGLRWVGISLALLVLWITTSFRGGVFFFANFLLWGFFFTAGISKIKSSFDT